MGDSCKFAALDGEACRARIISAMKPGRPYTAGDMVTLAKIPSIIIAGRQLAVLHRWGYVKTEDLPDKIGGWSLNMEKLNEPLGSRPLPKGEKNGG